MAAVIKFQEREMSMEKGLMLDKMIEEQERQLENAQHRLVIELASNRLATLREMQRRLLVDRSMIRFIPSNAARQALDDVFHDFETRVQGILDGMDNITQKLIAAYSDREEHEETYERTIKMAMESERRFFGKKESIQHYSKAALEAKSMAEAMDRVLQLRKEMRTKEQALQQGQGKILGLIEEFIDRYQEKNTKTVSDDAVKDRSAAEADAKAEKTAETSLYS